MLAAVVRRPVRLRRGETLVLPLVLQGAVVVALMAGSFTLCRHYLLQSIWVRGSSMVPALQERHWYLASPLWLRVKEASRGDIVVLKDPTDGAPVVKRIIAVAGDTVELRDGRVWLNGRPLEEPYLEAGMQTWPVRKQWSRVTCGAGEVYVLGDNRAVSSDSREYGPVPYHSLLGRVLK